MFPFGKFSAKKYADLAAIPLDYHSKRESDVSLIKEVSVMNNLRYNETQSLNPDSSYIIYK